MKKRGFFKRGGAAMLSIAVSAVTLFGGLPGVSDASTVYAAGTSADKTIKISTTNFSKFHDTDDDGLGEFEGFGTSLCWWANRVGYSDELAKESARLFYNADEGLGLTIGRYNVGGGDGIISDVNEEDDGIVAIPVNENALIYGPDDAIKPFSGRKMEVSTETGFKNARYTKSDADFGITRGKKVGDKQVIGWINDLDEAVGDGGNLYFDVNAKETGKYTIKMLFELSGTNERGVSLKVERPSTLTENVSVESEIFNAEPDSDIENGVVVNETEEKIEETKNKEDEVTSDAALDDASNENTAEVKDDTDETEVVSEENNKVESVTLDETENSDESPVVISEDAIVTPEVVEHVESVPETTSETKSADDVQADDTEADVNLVDDAQTVGVNEDVTADTTVTVYRKTGSEVNKDVIAKSGNTLYRVIFSDVELTEGSNRLTIAGNGDWTLDFMAMAVIKAGEEGILPEGADETEIPENKSLLHASHITRSDSEVPGYCVDVTKINLKEHELSYYEENFDRADAECGYAWNYDWNADYRQVNVLKAGIEAAGEDAYIAEAFSNSPPYFMTVSGCTSGNVDASVDNLRADSVNAFATYMADVIEHLESEGIHVQSATPMNEPDTNYWGAYSNKQEGCHFDGGESQSRIIVALRKELDKRGLSHVISSASDETSIDTAITNYKKLSDEAKEAVTRIDTHSYSGSKRAELRTLAEESGENLWMSEVDGSNTAGRDAGEMAGGLWLSSYIAKDLNGLMPSAWIIWDIIDTHVSNKEDCENNEVAKKYTKSYNKFDTATDIDSWLSSANLGGGNSLWGIAIADHNNQNIVLTKKYYAFGQYSRYIRPGYTLLGSSDSTVAAYDAKTGKVVIVATNTESDDKTWKFDLSGFKGIGTNVTAIRTSGTLTDGENWADVSDSDDIAVDESKKFFTATVKGNSVTTYIIDNCEYTNEIETVEKVDCDYIFAVDGTVPVLPSKVKIVTSLNNEKEVDVTWNTEGVDLTQKDTKVKGIAEGIEFEAQIKFVKSNMYFNIDCNADDSKTAYPVMNSYAELINEVPDKKYEEGSWGRLADYGAYNSNDDDAWNYGWYAYSNQAIEYTIPMDAGKYNLEFGFKEWWNQSRPMAVYANGTKLGNTNSKNGGNNWNTPNYKYEVAETGEVTFKVDKTSNNDPVLSFIRAQKLLNLDELKTVYNAAATLDTTGMTISKKNKLHSLLEKAMDIMLKSSSTQDDVDNVKAELSEFVGSQDTVYTEEDIQKNDNILYLVDVGSTNTSMVPSDYKLGLYQSVTDKAYGEDVLTGLTWGYDENDENSIRVTNGSTKSKLTDTCIYMSDSISFVKGKSGFGYKFELPDRASDYYNVSLGFKVPSGWGSKKVDIVLEDKTVAESVSIGETLSEKAYSTKVTDGVLNVFVHNPNAGTDRGADPILSYIIVKAENAFTVSDIQKIIDEEKEAMEGKEYLASTLTKYEQVLETANKLIEEASTDQDEIRKVMADLKDAFEALIELHFETYSDISGVEGRNLYDDGGLQIQAHGGQIQQFTVDGVTKYYWYGEDKTYDYRPVTGVHLYTSTDLYNWKDEGLALKAISVSEEEYDKDLKGDYSVDLSVFENDEYFKELYSDYVGLDAADSNLYSSKLEEVYWNIASDKCVMERPKVIYNDKTGKYVMWWHCDGRTPENTNNYGKAMVGIAVADKPEGPFKFVEARKLISADDADLGWDTVRGSSRDMNLFKDDDGSAYVIYSSDGNANMYLAKLNDEYTGLAADTEGLIEGVTYRHAFTTSREAPAMFKYNGKYYMITSQCTGWSPNQAGYAVADSPLGEWTMMGDPCTDDTKRTTYDTQSTCVFAVDAAAGKFIYMGDRWKESDLSDSRYVWLPVEFLSGDRIALRSYSNWTLDELEGKGTFELVTEFEDTFTSAEDALNKLPSEVEIKLSDDSTTKVNVTWDVAKAFAIGDFEVTGTLSNGRIITHSVHIVPENLVYFFDCGGVLLSKENAYFASAKELLGDKLINTVSDQEYTEENKAGYVGIVRTSNENVYDVGLKDSGEGVFDHGFWAGSNKNIEYDFDLEQGEYTVTLGFQEWWNTSRPTSIVVKSGEEKIAEKNFTLKNNDSARLETLTFTLEAASHVEVVVSKTGNPDPVLSFVAVSKVENGGQSGDEPSDPDEPVNDDPSQPSEPENNEPGTTEPATPSENGQGTSVGNSENNAVNTVPETNNAVDKEKKEESLYKAVTGSLKKEKKGKNKGLYKLVLKDKTLAKGFVSLKGKKYYFNKKGYAKKGFVKTNGTKIYTDKKGKVAIGFKKISGKKYYFDENGMMAKGLTEIKGSTYYFDKNGVMKTGKVKVGKKTYTFNKNGKLKASKNK